MRRTILIILGLISLIISQNTFAQYKGWCNACNGWVPGNTDMTSHYCNVHGMGCPNTPGNKSDNGKVKTPIIPTGDMSLDLLQVGFFLLNNMDNNSQPTEKQKLEQEKISQELAEAQRLERERIERENIRQRHIQDSISAVKHERLISTMFKISEADNLHYEPIVQKSELKMIGVDEAISTTNLWGESGYDTKGVDVDPYYDTKVVDLRDFKNATYIGLYFNKAPTYVEADAFLDEALKVANGSETSLIMPDEASLPKVNEAGLKAFQEQNNNWRKATDFRLKQTEALNKSLENKAMADKAVSIAKKDLENAIANKAPVQELHERLAKILELQKQADGYVKSSQMEMEKSKIREEREKTACKQILQEEAAHSKLSNEDLSMEARAGFDTEGGLNISTGGQNNFSHRDWVVDNGTIKLKSDLQTVPSLKAPNPTIQKLNQYKEPPLPYIPGWVAQAKTGQKALAYTEEQINKLSENRCALQAAIQLDSMKYLARMVDYYDKFINAKSKERQSYMRELEEIQEEAEAEIIDGLNNAISSIFLINPKLDLLIKAYNNVSLTPDEKFELINTYNENIATIIDNYDENLMKGIMKDLNRASKIGIDFLTLEDNIETGNILNDYNKQIDALEKLNEYSALVAKSFNKLQILSSESTQSTFTHGFALARLGMNTGNILLLNNIVSANSDALGAQTVGLTEIIAKRKKFFDNYIKHKKNFEKMMLEGCK